METNGRRTKDALTLLGICVVAFLLTVGPGTGFYATTAGWPW